MSTEDQLRTEWSALRDRLQVKQLLRGEGASLSLRIPGSDAMWFGRATDAAPARA